jgi:hypothetical protein
MTPSIATILMQSGGGPSTRFEATHFEVILVSLVVGAGLLVSICWQLIDNWYARVHGRNWPTVSAVIDVVSVTTVEDNTPSSLAVHFGSYYLAKLTYSYRNPEKQMGDYTRRFGNEGDAKAWANSYKGETVKVHVDPRDPTRSLLREEDL